MRAAAALAAAALALLPGCGGSDKAPALTGAQAQGLMGRIAQIRSAAAAHDVQATQAGLSNFTFEVERLRRAGALDAPTAAALATGAARAGARAGSELAPPAPAPQPAQQAAPAQPPADSWQGQGDGNWSGGGDGGGGD